MTLAEAQAQCTKKGGLLVVIYTAQITASGPAPQVPETVFRPANSTFPRPRLRPRHRIRLRPTRH